jgi:hypothetical protein
MWWRGVFQIRYAAAFDERRVAGECTNALLLVSEILWFLFSQRLLLIGKTGAGAHTLLRRLVGRRRACRFDRLEALLDRVKMMSGALGLSQIMPQAR